MIKKLLLLLMLVGGAALIVPSSNALEAVTKTGAVSLAQEGTETELGFAVGINIPLASDSAKTIAVGNETDILYVEKEMGEMKELTIIRTFLVTTKQLPYNLHVKIGTGGWKFINTDGDDIDKFALRFGVGWKSPVWGIVADLGLDVVKAKGPDMYAPSLTITLLGL